MSEEAGFDTWESDTGPDWEDEWGEEYEDDGDNYWLSDYDREPHDEPYCFACWDSGWDHRKDRRCKTCHPTRFQMFRWLVAGWFNRVRYRRHWNNEEGPF